MGSFILTPLLLQNVLGFTETKTGLVSIARPLAFAAGRAHGRDRVGAAGGHGGPPRAGAVGRGPRHGVDGHLGRVPPVIVIMGALALAGVGMGIAMPPLVGVGHRVGGRPRDYGIAGAAQQMVNQVGVVVGITVMQMVQQSRVAAVGLEASYHWGYATGVAWPLVGVLDGDRASRRPGPPCRSRTATAPNAPADA
jgi:hypothetical protein